MKRTQKSNQRVAARHDVHSSTSRLQASTASSKAKINRTATGTGQKTTGSSQRDVKHTSLRVNTPATAKDAAKSASFAHINTTKSRDKAPAADVKSDKNLPTDQEAFYLNLLLLGFNAEEASTKHKGASIPFDKYVYRSYVKL